MQACLLNKKVPKALEIYQEMIGELGRLPDRKAHSVLVDGCLNAGAFHEAVEDGHVISEASRERGVPLRLRFRQSGAVRAQRRGRSGAQQSMVCCWSLAEVGVEPKALSDLANKVAAGRVADVEAAMEVRCHSI